MSGSLIFFFIIIFSCESALLIISPTWIQSDGASDTQLPCVYIVGNKNGDTTFIFAMMVGIGVRCQRELWLLLSVSMSGMRGYVRKTGKKVDSGIFHREYRLSVLKSASWTRMMPMEWPLKCVLLRRVNKKKRDRFVKRYSNISVVLDPNSLPLLLQYLKENLFSFSLFLFFFSSSLHLSWTTSLLFLFIFVLLQTCSHPQLLKIQHCTLFFVPCFRSTTISPSTNIHTDNSPTCRP